MRLLTTVVALRCYLEQQRLLERKPEQQGRNDQFWDCGEDGVASSSYPKHREVGLVPTMGALHAGHLSLIEQARQENDILIVSIFVNPLQFGPTEDFQKYPRQLERDWQLCEDAGVDAIFAPPPEELGIPSRSSSERSPMVQVIPPPEMTSGLCGRSRLGHFQGVATIVTKLFNLIEPQRAYFGQKDAQQLAIIRRLVADLNFPIEIVACPIIREASGLALSSRNQYLSLPGKQTAAVLYQGLRQAEQAFFGGERSRLGLVEAFQSQLTEYPEVQLEYIDLVHPHTLMPLEQIEEIGLLATAARIESTRLIDNLVLRDRAPIVAIDGPAGAGKSTVARQVARALGLLYLDTGAMYRAVTWLVLQSGLALDDEVGIAELVSRASIDLTPTEVWINEQNVTQAIRSIEVTSRVSAISAQRAVRRELVKQQQQWGNKGGIVAEGRDIGTHVFPNAELKIFLTASVQERARRRQQDFSVQGEQSVSLQQLERDISERDRADSNRSISPLRKAPDAIEIQSDRLSIAEVTERIVNLYQQKVMTSALNGNNYIQKGQTIARSDL
ncbi:bifunctional pantoate--beta-alanine ligase/(d)CMP kinase [Desertifilum sp. FACHB-1129]|uniref:Bifunctional pantoate ligase/cytidylate kinase n=1 Tax=Desertifilum tharense IPPAS B-1220 TaxID=1781255 RepID=A0A1E5QDG2_9CYAN|nr:bifunctional pantoate--beta-alanine ligase/(d)CMP kinase [Desertifilum tharense]MBD2312107.1 bifunctional pantoate--beta-alanine ligase/(d)CMP kinase [Desertifilum sp. FACHB-1129]MBD2322232.1 bifunctional pantoate--beta-alanine ligase/(d)CMP kinase [Desertifilum sp. FACHB-866]MBD2332269.1 bifunctional pantoate--beta-alanine ligase/(d)CMP kinase [Desertifilum sp. FACHB-868]MDA0210874.1 bifunctional pantoate--beta-alanine ligase/(d)CMP kinase [Cyanobacteria bacterium FC1]OEJ72373.1 cytidylate